MEGWGGGSGTGTQTRPKADHGVGLLRKRKDLAANFRKRKGGDEHGRKKGAMRGTEE